MARAGGGASGAEAWRETFNFFDKGRTGRIAAEDLATCLQSFGQQVSLEGAREMLREADLDHSGHVEFDDFVKLMASDRARKVSRSALQRYFESLDKDGSGFITAAELRHAYTALGHGLSDGEMDAIVDRYDLDGNGVLTLDEFVALVADGHGVELVGEPEPPGRAGGGPAPRRADKGDLVEVKDKKLAAVLAPMANAAGQVRLSDLQAAMDLWTLQQGGACDPERDPSLHWEKGRAKHGLAPVIQKANHVAIVVSDVGKSAVFYSEVIGLQQIRRPNFDRHGAWFTMGNLELHLIKGEPAVHSGQDLIVNHVALQTFEVDRVPEILTRAGVPFRQNVSMPVGAVKPCLKADAGGARSNIVTQYFLRDPDGYHIEISNCEVLTEYCFGEVPGHDQAPPAHLAETAVFVHLAEELARRAAEAQEELGDLCEELKWRPVADIAARLGCARRAARVDETKLRRLLARRAVFGDICQNESEEGIREILLLADNHLPTAMKIMEIRGWDGAVIAPPAFFEAGKRRVKPDAFLLPKYSSVVV